MIWFGKRLVTWNTLVIVRYKNGIFIYFWPQIFVEINKLLVNLTKSYENLHKSYFCHQKSHLKGLCLIERSQKFTQSVLLCQL